MSDELEPAAYKHPPLTFFVVMVAQMTADPAYPKLTATALLEQLPAAVSDDDWRARLSADQYYILREVQL